MSNASMEPSALAVVSPRRAVRRPSENTFTFTPPSTPPTDELTRSCVPGAFCATVTLTASGMTGGVVSIVNVAFVAAWFALPARSVPAIVTVVLPSWIVPPFCVFATPEVACRPFSKRRSFTPPDNVWGEPSETVVTLKGHPTAARYLTAELLNAQFDIPYAYTTRYEHGLAHAFINTVLYLDWDRTGFPYPVVAFHVNCYGSAVIQRRGGAAAPASPEPDPPGPTPARCFDVGAATARVLAKSPWRVALIGSSSWSHAFLTGKTDWIEPDLESDRKRLEELRAGRYATTFMPDWLATGINRALDPRNVGRRALGPYDASNPDPETARALTLIKQLLGAKVAEVSPRTGIEDAMYDEALQQAVQQAQKTLRDEKDIQRLLMLRGR